MRMIQEVLSDFTAAASNPRAMLEAYLKQGKRAIGCMPYFCTEELVHAAGMIPFGLWGAQTQIFDARRYLPAFICSIIQTTLELGMRGSYNGLSAVMAPILCDSLKSMDGNWRSSVKDIPLIPVAHAQNRKIAAGCDFTASQYRKVSTQLEEISGKRVTDADIHESITLYNERNAAVRRFIEVSASKPGAVKASVRNAVFKSSYFMDVAEYTALVEELCGCLAAATEADLPDNRLAGNSNGKAGTGKAVNSKAGPAIVTCGIIADNTGLLSILDECGVFIVDDVVTHESLRFRYDTPMETDPFAALAQTIGMIEGCPILFDPGKKRFDMLADIVRQRSAEGVLIVMTKFCDPEEYDIVPLRRALQKNGIKNLSVEVDQQTTDAEQIRTAIETFCDMLGNAPKARRK